MSKQIIVSVSPDGEVSIEAVGYKGQACRKATEALEHALGQVKTYKPKPEMYQANAQQQKA